MSFFSNFSILLFLFAGIVIGFTIFPPKFLKVNGIVQTVGILLTLFFVGVSLGGSETFFEDIKVAGINAIVLMLGAVLFSIIIVYLITKIFFKEKK